MKAISRLSSGRVVVKSPVQVATDRYQLLDLASAEPNLGTAANGSVLTTTTTGQRVFTKNLTVDNVTVATNLVANKVYSDNFLYANGDPFISAGTLSNIYNGNITVGTSVTLVDTVSATGVSGVSWSVTARDTINSALRSSTIDSVNDGTALYYNEYGVVLSNNNLEVAVFTSNVVAGSINLYALGESASVVITYQRTTLGTGTVPGYIAGAGYIQNVIGSGTATTCVVDTFVGTGAQINYTLSATPSNENQVIAVVAGIVQPRSVYNVSGAVLTFTAAPDAGVPVEFTTFVTTTITGAVGATGAAGFTGSSGAFGFTGSSGSSGTSGFTGSASTAPGFTGSFGYTGSAGSGGASGFTGFTGSAGSGSTTSEQLTWSYYNTEAELPNAAAKHGMFAHVHGTGYGYMAHAGAWIKLANYSDISGASGYTGSAGSGGASGFAGSAGYTGSAGTFSGTVAGNLSVSGTTFVTGDILPTSNNTVNIGSATNRFGTLFLSANTIDLGGTTISTTPTGDLAFVTASGNIDITANTVNFLSTIASTTVAPGATVAPVASIYATVANLPAGVATGTLAYVSAAARLFIYTGSIWVNTAPATKNFFYILQTGSFTGPIVGTVNYSPTRTITLSSLEASVAQAAATNIVFSVLKNGTVIQSFTLPTGNTSMESDFGNNSITTADLVTMNIASGAGQDLAVRFIYT